jgi:hypothetical protein
MSARALMTFRSERGSWFVLVAPFCFDPGAGHWNAGLALTPPEPCQARSRLRGPAERGPGGSALPGRGRLGKGRPAGRRAGTVSVRIDTTAHAVTMIICSASSAVVGAPCWNGTTLAAEAADPAPAGCTVTWVAVIVVPLVVPSTRTGSPVVMELAETAAPAR